MICDKWWPGMVILGNTSECATNNEPLFPFKLILPDWYKDPAKASIFIHNFDSAKPLENSGSWKLMKGLY